MGRKRRSRRGRAALVGALVLVGAALARPAAPLVRLTATAVGDALHPLPNRPAPYAALPPSSATLPVGRLVFDSDRTGNFEIYTMAADGGDVRPLTADRRFDSWWARPSPDRRHVLFYRTPAGTHDRDVTRNSLWVMGADGSNPRELRPVGTDGWRIQGHAEWSPDGRQLVMAGGNRLNPQIWVTTSSGRPVRRVTDRGGTNIDPSWWPDGRRIWFVGCPGRACFERDYEVYSVAAEGGPATRLTRDGLRDHDPYASPDGGRVAWLTRTATAGIGQWNIRIARPDGSGLGRVTDDRQVNSKPEWSRDGRLLYFHRLEQGRRPGFGIFAVRPDGTGRRELTTGQPGSSEYPGA